MRYGSGENLGWDLWENNPFLLLFFNVSSFIKLKKKNFFLNVHFLLLLFFYVSSFIKLKKKLFFKNIQSLINYLINRKSIFQYFNSY